MPETPLGLLTGNKEWCFTGKEYGEFSPLCFSSSLSIFLFLLFVFGLKDWKSWEKSKRERTRQKKNGDLGERYSKKKLWWKKGKKLEKLRDGKQSERKLEEFGREFEKDEEEVK